MSIKLTDVEFKEMPEDDSGNIETRGRIILGCSVITGELDRKKFKGDLKQYVETDISNQIMKHIYGDLIPLVGGLSKLAKRRAIPVEAMIIDRILLDMAAIIAGKDKLIVKALKV